MLNVVVLAAGKGTRMNSELPKVLHPIAGKPMLEHVLDTCKQVDDCKPVVVIGHGAERVKDTFHGRNVSWAIQAEQLGTGHAVQQAVPKLDDDATVLILMGDVPLIKAQTLIDLVRRGKTTGFGLLTLTIQNPTGYGRIIRANSGQVTGIVEEKDATPEQRLVKEVNTGVMAIKASYLKRWLTNLSSNNAQGEYYLTDVVERAVEEGIEIATQAAQSEHEVMGINNRAQQAFVERAYQREIADQLLADGVTLADPQRIDVRGNLTVGKDTYIDVNAVFVGDVSIGNNVTIEPNCFISDSSIGDNVHIKANTVLEQAVLSANNEVGPFARLRPGTELADGAKIGNFVETKKAKIGNGSKVNHLSYVGDAEIGIGSNIGAGTITCNYDGVNKFKTIIGDEVFVGSNSTLVAPVSIGDSGFVAAGSVITKTVNKNSLAIGRSKQIAREGWTSPKAKAKLKTD